MQVGSQQNSRCSWKLGCWRRSESDQRVLKSGARRERGMGPSVSFVRPHGHAAQDVPARSFAVRRDVCNSWYQELCTFRACPFSSRILMKIILLAYLWFRRARTTSTIQVTAFPLPEKTHDATEEARICAVFLGWGQNTGGGITYRSLNCWTTGLRGVHQMSILPGNRLERAEKRRGKGKRERKGFSENRRWDGDSTLCRHKDAWNVW